MLVDTSSCHSGVSLLQTTDGYFSLPPPAKSISVPCEYLLGKMEAYQHLASRPAGAVLILRSRNAAMGDPFPSTTFGKGSAMPD